MKRIGIFVSLLFLCIAPPTLLSAHWDAPAATRTLETELPWSTVNAALKKVADQGHYAYSQLISWYDAGLLTVTQSAAGGYEVRINSADGGLDIVIIQGL